MATVNRSEHDALELLYREKHKNCVPFDNFLEDANRRLLFHDDEELNRWKKYFTTILNRITSSCGLTVTYGYGLLLQREAKLFLPPTHSKEAKLIVLTSSLWNFFAHSYSLCRVPIFIR